MLLVPCSCQGSAGRLLRAMWGTRLKPSVFGNAVDLATQPEVCAEAARFAQLLVCIRWPVHPCPNNN